MSRKSVALRDIQKKNDARETKNQAKANCGGVVRFTRVRGRSLSLFSFLCAQHTFLKPFFAVVLNDYNVKRPETS